MAKTADEALAFVSFATQGKMKVCLGTLMGLSRVPDPSDFLSDDPDKIERARDFLALIEEYMQCLHALVNRTLQMSEATHLPGLSPEAVKKAQEAEPDMVEPAPQPKSPEPEAPAPDPFADEMGDFGSEELQEAEPEVGAEEFEEPDPAPMQLIEEDLLTGQRRVGRGRDVGEAHADLQRQEAQGRPAASPQSPREGKNAPAAPPAPRTAPQAPQRARRQV